MSSSEILLFLIKSTTTLSHHNELNCESNMKTGKIKIKFFDNAFIELDKNLMIKILFGHLFLKKKPSPITNNLVFFFLSEWRHLILLIKFLSKWLIFSKVFLKFLIFNIFNTHTHSYFIVVGERWKCAYQRSATRTNYTRGLIVGRFRPSFNRCMCVCVHWVTNMLHERELIQD